MNMTKCIYAPSHDCEYADCRDCPDYDQLVDNAPDPDEVYEMEREEKLYG